MNIKMSKYGKHLSSRLLCREMVTLQRSEIIASREITIDFQGVSIMTMSFGTELFDSILSIKNVEDLRITNTSKLVASIVKFCLANQKDKDFA